MQNQMMPKINLLKMPDPAARTAKYVNMMNATKQLEAEERQTKMAQETLDLKKKEDVREEALQVPRLNKAQQENILDALKIFREGVADIAEGDVAAAEAVRADLVGRVPGWDKVLPPAAKWDRNTRYRLMVEAEKEFNSIFATPVASVGVDDRTGQTTSITAGGLDPRAESIGKVEPTPVAAPAEAQPPRTPVAPAPAGVPMRATQGANTTPRDLEAQGMDRRNIPSGMPTSPASFTPGSMGTPTVGQMTPDMVPAILDSAINTGVMAQIDLDQMLAMTPPQARQGIMDVIRSSNISLQADAPSLAASAMPQQQPMTPNPVGRQQPQFAVMRGQAPQATLADLGGAPEMQNVMAQSQGRTPFIARRESPTPGVYGVPTGQVAETSRATRPSKQEVFDTELAKLEAQRKAGPPPLTTQQKRARKTEVAKAYAKTQTLVDRAYDPKEGVVALALKIKALSDDQKEAITGLSGYIPSFRGSTKEADTLIGNLKGIVTALGKDTAAASGSIGPMAAQEWKTVADMIADLKLEGMTPRALGAQMDRIIRQVDLATNLAQRVYDVQYSDDIKEYPEFRVRGNPSAKTKTPVVKGGSRISPDIDKILKSRGI